MLIAVSVVTGAFFLGGGGGGGKRKVAGFVHLGCTYPE